MKNNFTQSLFIGLLLASFVSFLLTKNIDLSLSFLWIFIYNLIFFGFIYIDIIIHEFGHAIAGWIVNFPIKRITIGFGHNIFKYKFNGTTLLINQGLQGGLINPGTFSPDFLRLRYFFFTLGGIGLQVVVMALVMIIISAIKSIYPLALNNASLFLTIVNIFLFSNFILIFLNLLPFKVNMMGVPMPTDGLQLITIFFMNQQKIQEILLSGKIIEGMEYLEEKDFPKAELIFRECIANNSKYLIPKINLSVALIRQQKVDEAIALLSKIITESDKNAMQLFIFNNLAWSYLLKGLNQREFLNLADDYSAKAINITNQHLYVVGTRACVLIEIGKIDEGIKLLKGHISLNKAVNETTNPAIGFLYLAYAYYLKANRKEYQKHWQKINNNEDLKSNEYRLVFDHILEKTNYFTMP
ncbi:site-2 protease family protein [Nostoc sp.]|uniref:site-2 protease family protein n=1 Tax=Nostoc sp. TaxID=1180 RepID=UPI002FF4B2A4